MKFTVKSGRELGVHELYNVLRLRSSVFIVELKCHNVVDADGEDLVEGTYHLQGYNDTGKLVCYARIHKLSDSTIKIRRVVVATDERGHGYARQMMEFAHEWAKTHDFKEILLPARRHLRKFYESVGYKVISEDYFLDSVQVWHVDMLLKL